METSFINSKLSSLCKNSLLVCCYQDHPDINIPMAIISLVSYQYLETEMALSGESQ